MSRLAQLCAAVFLGLCPADVRAEPAFSPAGTGRHAQCRRRATFDLLHSFAEDIQTHSDAGTLPGSCVSPASRKVAAILDDVNHKFAMSEGFVPLTTCVESGDHVTHWDPYTPWERLPKWARVLLIALIVAVLLWLIFTLASYIAGAGAVGSTNLDTGALNCGSRHGSRGCSVAPPLSRADTAMMWFPDATYAGFPKSGL